MLLFVSLVLAEGPGLLIQPLAAPDPMVRGRYLAGAAGEDCSLFPVDCVDIPALLALGPRDLLGRSDDLSRVAQRMASDALAVLDLCGEAPCSPTLRGLHPMMAELGPALALSGVRTAAAPDDVTRRRLDYRSNRQSLTAEVLCSVPADPSFTACTLTVRQDGALALVYGGDRSCGALTAQVAAVDGSITYVARDQLTQLVIEGARR